MYKEKGKIRDMRKRKFKTMLYGEEVNLDGT